MKSMRLADRTLMPRDLLGPGDVAAAGEATAAGVTAAPRRSDAGAAPADLAHPRRQVTLDLQRLARIGYLVPANRRSALAEEFRHFKRGLVRQARSQEAVAQRLSLIMMTSSVPGEGKTFCAINLALSIAMEVDTSVLLVDADAARADLPKRLGFAAQRGLLDLLGDSALALDDVVLATNVPKLSLLPCGESSGDTTELFASEAMGRLLLTLAARSPGQIVIFDGPPLLATSEAKVLASRLGQVVLVVAASTTPRSAVAMALAELESCPKVVALLNKAAEPAIPADYGY